MRGWWIIQVSLEISLDRRSSEHVVDKVLLIIFFRRISQNRVDSFYKFQFSFVLFAKKKIPSTIPPATEILRENSSRWTFFFREQWNWKTRIMLRLYKEILKSWKYRAQDWHISPQIHPTIPSFGFFPLNCRLLLLLSPTHPSRSKMKNSWQLNARDKLFSPLKAQKTFF